MWLLLDKPGIQRFDYLRSEQLAAGDVRHYYCLARADTHLALLVLRTAQRLPRLAGQVVDAGIGWEEGAAGYVYITSRLHSKITVYGPVDLAAQASLSDILQQAPRRKE